MPEVAALDEVHEGSELGTVWVTGAVVPPHPSWRSEDHIEQDSNALLNQVSLYAGGFNELFVHRGDSGSNIALFHHRDIPSGPLFRWQYGNCLAVTAQIETVAFASETDLLNALEDLRGVRCEAIDEEIPEPSNTAVENAEFLLTEMYSISRRRFEVYPTPDAEVAIYASGGYKRSVLVFCESAGEVLCMVNMNGQHRRARYDSARKLPDGFIREALVELDHAASPRR